MRREFYQDLADEYLADPNVGKCNLFQDGQDFIVDQKDFWKMMNGEFCAEAWISFIQIEKRAEAPILDPQVFFNRTFMTAASAGMLSFFGTLGIMAYSPIIVQEVMRVSPAHQRRWHPAILAYCVVFTRAMSRK